jgi:hypothetical protein
MIRSFMMAGVILGAASSVRHAGHSWRDDCQASALHRLPCIRISYDGDLGRRATRTSRRKETHRQRRHDSSPKAFAPRPSARRPNAHSRIQGLRGTNRRPQCALWSRVRRSPRAPRDGSLSLNVASASSAWPNACSRIRGRFARSFLRVSNHGSTSVSRKRSRPSTSDGEKSGEPALSLWRPSPSGRFGPAFQSSAV